MASEEDNFDIDIYGDGGEENHGETSQQTQPDELFPGPDGAIDEQTSVPEAQESGTPVNGHDSNSETKDEIVPTGSDEFAQKIASTDQSAAEAVHLPKQAPQTQGVKRKEGEEDDRYVDPGATTALFVSELHWWITDDDVRGWANQSQCEDELEDMTFSEHKVNGKSKGQVYILFKSMQAATAVKRKIETFGEGQQYAKKFTASYSNPYSNPFKTLPKDGPMRNNTSSNNSRGNSGGMQAYSGSGYRGGRGGGYSNRGGAMNHVSSYNRGGFQQQSGGFQGNAMASFPQMGGMQPYGGFQGRGGMMGGMRGGGMGMRGGRGGMMGMPMGMGMGMGMGSMGMGVGMPQMGGMGMPVANSFQGNQTGFNPVMFNQPQQSSPGYGGDHPHPAKRTRQD